MAFFNFVNEIVSAAEKGYDKFVTDNEKEIKAAADGAAAVWSIGSKLAGIAADAATDAVKGAYDSLTEEVAKATAHSDAADNNKALIEKLRKQNEELQRRLDEMEAAREAEEQICRQEAQEDYDLEYWADMQQPEEDYPAEIYENMSQREVVVKLAGVGEAYAVQAMHYLLNKYPSGVNLPWVKVDGEEQCVTILRPEGGFTYIGDSTVEEML